MVVEGKVDIIQDPKVCATTFRNSKDLLAGQICCMSGLVDLPTAFLSTDHERIFSANHRGFALLINLDRSNMNPVK